MKYLLLKIAARHKTSCIVFIIIKRHSVNEIETGATVQALPWITPHVYSTCIYIIKLNEYMYIYMYICIL